MHVLIIPSEEFLPPQSHLAGIFQKHQALALQQAGCKVGVISIRQSLSVPMLLKAMLFKLVGKQPANELKDQSILSLVGLLVDKIFRVNQYITNEKIDELEVLRIDGFYFLPPSKHTNHIGWVKAGKAIWKKYCALHGTPDIIHAHNAVYAGILANQISKQTGIPYCITEHSSFVARNLESGLIRNRIKKAYEQAAGFFVVSHFLGQKIDLLYDTKFKWKQIPNVLDPTIEKAPMLTENLPMQPFLFISIGSLIPLKRHQDLIEAFHQQFAADEQVQLVIAGDGELKQALQSQIDRLGLQHRVQLTDRMNRQQVLQLIDRSHALVLCSGIETFGVVLIEALSRGKPVIATKCGGPESIVEESNGLLCPIGDINALSKAMLQIKDNYQQYLPASIRAAALQRYSQDAFAQQLIKEYEALIS